MIVGIPLHDVSESKASKLAAAIAAAIPGSLDTKTLIENFAILAEAAGGTAELRKLVTAFALRGRLATPRHGTNGPPEPPPSKEIASIASSDLPCLPPHWVWKPLESLVSFGPKNGYSPKAVEFETPVKTLTLTATTSGRFDGRFFKYIDEDIPADSEFWLRDGDLLVQRGNTIEYVGIAAVYRGPGRTFIYPDLMMKLRLSEEVDLSFVHMALNGPLAREFMMSRASGTSGTMPKINQTTLLAVPIPVPPLAEQKRIVGKVDELMRILDDLEAKQAKKRNTQDRLRAAALTALTSAEEPQEFEAAWRRVGDNLASLAGGSKALGDLRRTVVALACRGALTKRIPADGTGADVLRRIDEARRAWAEGATRAGNAEAARVLKKIAEQGAPGATLVLPATWASTTLLAACWQLVDCHNKTAPYTNAGVMLVRTSNVRDGRIRLEGVRYVSEETYARWSRRCPPEPGDVLFTREAPMGEVGLIDKGTRLCLGQRMMLLRPFPDLLDAKYLLLAIQDPAFQTRMQEVAVGSTVKHLRVGDVESLAIPVPPMREQHRIVTKVEHLMKLCDDLEAKLRCAEETASKLVEAVVADMVAA